MPRSAWTTLYFPAGTYRLESTLKNARRQHSDWLGCQIIGEDPATTVLVWHGPKDQWMWGLDAWYCKVSRLSFDGRSHAGVGLMRWNNFSTYCELSDLWFKDIPGTGLCLGSHTNNHEGQAEHAVERCRFTHCGTGILTADWNTMDIYVWFCLFEDCGRGIYNNMGGYQAFANVFLRLQGLRSGNLEQHGLQHRQQHLSRLEVLHGHLRGPSATCRATGSTTPWTAWPCRRRKRSSTI